jgi:hypothetical protein
VSTTRHTILGEFVARAQSRMKVFMIHFLY